MTSSAEGPESYHVLLVGIDAYPTKPLRGCVNDIDGVQELLLERVKVPEERIRRLASPHPGTAHPTNIPGDRATLANLRGALAALAAKAKSGDRVFIYYSGHGARIEFQRQDGSKFHREALVPDDAFDGPAEALLFDHELNQLLARLPTRSVTMVLDCCHAAGATREWGQGMTARTVDARDLGLTTPLREGEAGGARGDGVVRAVNDCHIISACLNHEVARESIDQHGRTHGLLTGAFLRSLAKLPDAELTSVAWSRIWYEMASDVVGQNPQQNLWMSGNARRAVLAGRPVDGDPGFSVRRIGDDYEIDAGVLANVTEPALVAVYGEQPDHFPPAGSKEARLGVLRVTSARASSATAKAEGAPFAVPPGARGRIIEPGALARLRCAVVPEDAAVDPTVVATLTAALEASPLLEVVEPGRAQVRLEQARDRWLLTDDLHDTRPGAELFSLSAHELDRAREVLDHYFYYAQPLRMAVSAIDLPGALDLRVLACPEALPPEEAEMASLAEAPTTSGTSTYDVLDGAGVCFRVHNKSRVRLRVTLVNAAASGKVEILDDQSIDAGRTHTFWADNTIGVPFELNIPDGKQQGVDRLIAIGTTANKTVDHLGLDRGFADILAAKRGSSDKDISSRGKNKTPIELWTATQVIVKTRAK